MASGKIVSDEQIVVALMNNTRYKDAAQQLGISERGLHNRITNGNFIALYQSAKNDLLRDAVKSLTAKTTEAINTICEIMSDKDTNNAVRLQAAQTLINTACKFADRLAEADASLKKQISSNQFNEKYHSLFDEEQ